MHILILINIGIEGFSRLACKINIKVAYFYQGKIITPAF